MKWFKVEDKLPANRKYVLVKTINQGWFDGDDQIGVEYTVAKFVKGITEQERESLPDSDDRKRCFKSGDVFGNNLVPYYWDTFGPDDIFGQCVTHWSEILPAI